MIDTISITDKGIGGAAEVEQPIPVGVIARQARDFQSQDNAHAPERDFSGHVSKAGALGQPRARDAEVLVKNFDLLALPSQLCGAFGQPVLALGGFTIVFDLCGGGLAHIDERAAPQMGGGDFGLIGHVYAPVRRVRRSRSERLSAPGSLRLWLFVCRRVSSRLPHCGWAAAVRAGSVVPPFHSSPQDCRASSIEASR